MLWKKLLLTSLITAILSSGVKAAPSDYVSPNVPLSSPLYGYIEKFDGMGYLTSMTTGTKPYTRMQMAKWLTEIKSGAEKRPLPKYLEQMYKSMEYELAPELDVLYGIRNDVEFSIKETRLEVGRYSGNSFRYRYNTDVNNMNSAPRAIYQPFNINNDGYHYGENGNIIASVLLAGKISDEVAIALEPRFSYDSNQHGDVSLNSGYVKTRINGTSIQIGKDPVFWGHGATGSLILGNNMTPLTSIKISNLEPYTSKGFFRFLGDMNFTALYSELESNRTNVTKNEVDSPSFVAMRGTFTPKKNVTFGLSFTSMVGGNGKGLKSGDYWDWIVGRNSDVEYDKWNNIAGLDFKVRLPKLNGTQVYCELYGEDQANYMPSKVAERVGIYIPKLSKDGIWDMKVEYAHTTNWWYQHGIYTNGYVYKGDIIGDPIGHNSSQYYVQVGRYLDKDSRISFHANHVTQDQDAPVQQTVKSLWLQYQTKLQDNVHLDSQAGIARIGNANFTGSHDETNHFVGVRVRWLY